MPAARGSGAGFGKDDYLFVFGDVNDRNRDGGVGLLLLDDMKEFYAGTKRRRGSFDPRLMQDMQPTQYSPSVTPNSAASPAQRVVADRGGVTE